MNDTDHNAPVPFTPEEMLTLQALHTRYQDGSDRFSDRERERLLFLRWLYQSKLLDSRPERNARNGKKTRAVGNGMPTKREQHDVGAGSTRT